MYGCESWSIKKAECWRTDAFELGVDENSWELIGLQRGQTKIYKRNKSWIFIGKADAEAEAPILWSPDVKSWRTGKDPDAVKDWRREEKGTTEDEMVGWHHQLNGHEFEQTLGDGEGQGSLRAAVHGVAKSQTQLSDWTTTTTKEDKKKN